MESRIIGELMAPCTIIYNQFYFTCFNSVLTGFFSEELTLIISIMKKIITTKKIANNTL